MRWTWLFVNQLGFDSILTSFVTGKLSEPNPYYCLRCGPGMYQDSPSWFCTTSSTHCNSGEVFEGGVCKLCAVKNCLRCANVNYCMTGGCLTGFFELRKLVNGIEVVENCVSSAPLATPRLGLDYLTNTVVPCQQANCNPKSKATNLKGNDCSEDASMCEACLPGFKLDE